MLHRPTLIPSAMRTTSKNARKTLTDKCFKKSELCSSPFVNNEEIVVVEPTDPDEDRLEENVQQQQKNSTYCAELSFQVSKPATHVPESVPVKQPPVTIQPTPDTPSNFTTVIPLSSALQPFLSSALCSIPTTISNVPLQSINKLNGITPCLLPNSVPTMWLQTPTTTTNVSTTVAASDSMSTVSVPQSTASLHPLIAAVLINCATVNMISQLTGSFGTPLYVPASQGFNSIIPTNNLATVLPTLFANLPPNASSVTKSVSSSTNTPAVNTCVSSCSPFDTSDRSVSTSNLHSKGNRDTPTRPCAKRKSRLKRFACPMPNCSLTFYSRFNQAEHIRSHTGERPFICTVPDCSIAFSRYRDLHNHMRTHNLSRRELRAVAVHDTNGKVQPEAGGDGSSVRPFAVRKETDSSGDAVERDTIIMDPGSPKSDIAELSDGTTINALKDAAPTPRGQPARLEDNVGEKNSLCAERQMRRRHACPYVACDKTYLKLNKLKEHVRSHTGERPYVCREPGCGAAFVRLYGVRRHELIHAVGRKRLVRSHRRPDSPAVAVDSGENSPVDMNHDGGGSNDSSTTVPSSEPQIVPASAKTRVIIRSMDPVPILANPKQFKSDQPIAPIELKLDTTPSTSVTNVTRRVLPLIAPKTPVPMPFRPLSPLSGTPGVRRPHICPFKECSKAFPKLNKLREHICRHTGERPFVCDRCNASFVRMYDLRRHGKIHTRMVESRTDSSPLMPRTGADDNNSDVDLPVFIKTEPESQDLLS